VSTSKPPAAAAAPFPFTFGTSPALVAVSPDGKTLATASVADPIKLWDLATGKEQRTLAAAAGPVVALAFAPEGMGLWAVTIKDKGKGFPWPDDQALQA
jgi:WD40 repeat protein